MKTLESKKENKSVCDFSLSHLHRIVETPDLRSNGLVRLQFLMLEFQTILTILNVFHRKIKQLVTRFFFTKNRCEVD